MWSRVFAYAVVLAGMLLAQTGRADDVDSVVTCEFLAETTASSQTFVDCSLPSPRLTGTPHYLIVWAADPALPDSALPSCAAGVEDSLMLYLKTMSNGGTNPTLVRARRPGGAAGYAFVADSSFSIYRPGNTSDTDGRIGLLNWKLLKQVCGAGVDISGVDGIIFIYNNNPFRIGSWFGIGCMYKPAYGTADTTETLCNGRTLGWFMNTHGAMVRYRFNRADVRAALSFELAHEVEHTY